jgi:hypothetical protein
MKKELHNSIIFLDLSIDCREKEIKFTIYRNPAQKRYHNILSCHPHKHKISSINYLINTYPISKEAKTKTKHFIKCTT